MRWGAKRIRSGPRVEPLPPPPKPKMKMKRRRYDRSSSFGDSKDVCICIRLEYEDPKDVANIKAKWLRLKIPACLLHKRGVGGHDSPSSDIDFDDDDDEDYSTYYNDYFGCFLDPLNGPFEFPPFDSIYTDYPTWIRCAPLGSLMYALGADPTDVVSYRDILSQATAQVCPNVTTKAVTGGPASVKPPFPSQSITTSFHSSHRLHFCDFSKQNPKWQISPAPLISPRVRPKLVSMKGKIYAFGGNLLTDNQSPYAEVFDPRVGNWSPLPDPPFGKLADYELFVFPLHKSSRILLIGFVSQVVYTFDTSYWCWSPFRASTRLCDRLHFRGWLKYFHPVIYDETLYWIDQLGRLCAYVLEGEGRYFVGPISVFEGKDHCYINKVLKDRDNSYPLALLPISPTLLGLLWCDTHYAGCLPCASTLHITILHIYLNREIDLEHTDSNADKNAVPSLTAPAVACLCFPFINDITNVIDAYLIDDDKESWDLMSLCSSYLRVDREARY
ncbi:hypothetical protein POM88_041444 [Heracleum sosnowskyi]|uniref:Uncharacterized protein n=1 Tax=Heracleum sosnowskyi TaxID=360622 RepID=A0AAD8MBD2_9APIA|nr:hypothetical protein POM88_041444 [Heracleum sosnowskyi]